MRRLLIPVLLGLLVGACGILFGPSERRVVGLLSTIDPQYYDVPDSVSVGEAFTVYFQTEAEKSCYRRGETEVKIEGNVATITQYNYRILKADVCALPPLRYGHDATVRFVEVGEAQVILRGRWVHEYSTDIIELKWTVHVYSR